MIRLFILSLFLVTCSSGGEFIPPEFLHKPAFYFSEANQITLNVYYEKEAAPFTGDSSIIGKVWDIAFLNFEEIFSFKSIKTQINVPRELSDMKEIPALGRETWAVEDIIDLATEQKVVSVKNKEAFFSVFFVKGFFKKSGEIRNSVAGVNLSGTSVILIFKDVINSMPPGLKIFSEQATAVHEVGHALGFVNNGVPAVGSHFDGRHGAHSNEDECIMFHLNEAVKNLIAFAIRLNTLGDATIWGPGVLMDAEAFSQ